MKLKFFAFALILSLIAVTPKMVSASTMSLSAGGTIGIGQTKAVTVRLNGGEGINAVSAILNYPADKLDVTYVRGSGSFAIQAENSFGSGGIRISRGNFNPVLGNVTVATIGFRGKAEGSATVSFTGESQVIKAADNANSLGGTSGTTFNVVKSAPQPSAAPNSKTTTPGQQSSITIADTAKPNISEIKISNLSTDSATINWKTDKRSSSIVEFGIEKENYFLTESDNNLVLDHQINLKSPALRPGLKLYLILKSRDASENESISEELELQFKGYSALVKVVGQLGNPISNAEVKIYSDPMTQRTNKEGEAKFENLTAGKHLVVIKAAGVERTFEIEVKEDFALQRFNLKQSGVMSILLTVFSLNQLYLTLLITTLTAVLVFLGIRFILRRQRQI